MLSNDYREAQEVAFGLFAVQMSDGGWAIADGPGTALSAPDEMELAGFHVPVRFDSKEQAIDAIKTGPEDMFDLETDGEWARHCVASGGVACEAYRMDASAAPG